jgi:hypothetical protein
MDGVSSDRHFNGVPGKYLETSRNAGDGHRDPRSGNNEIAHLYCTQGFIGDFKTLSSLVMPGQWEKSLLFILEVSYLRSTPRLYSVETT